MAKIKDFVENLRQEKESISTSTIDFHYGAATALDSVEKVMEQSRGFFDFSYAPGETVYIVNHKTNTYEKRRIVSIQILEYGVKIVEFNKEIEILKCKSTKFNIDDIEEFVFSKKPFVDFYEAYTFIKDCYLFQDSTGNSRLECCIEIDVVKVNPKTLEIDNQNELNTLIQVWIETGRYDEKCRHHDYRLDCGGDTFEKAIIELANLVNKVYY